jgi:isocitrate dehydrogenase (NAD+)
MYPITLIPGDGTGPEISEATKKVLEATGVPIQWDIQEAGLDVFEKEGTPLPARVIDSIKKNKVAIKGPVTTPVGTGFRSVNVTLRQVLDLYCCLRPSRTFQGVRQQ